MNKDDTKQAIIGFMEFTKSITGNKDLKIPEDIAKEYGIEQDDTSDNLESEDKIEQATDRFKKWLESGFYRDRNGKSIVAKEGMSKDAISREAVISIIEESKEDDADEWMGYPWKVTPNLLMDEVRKLPSVHPIRPSVIEDIKAEIKSLYAYYGDGSGWEESRNITLNEVMRIIDEHTSGKEQA